MPTAAGLAEKIKAQTGIDPELIEGSGGIFDVVVDGKMIFSKQAVDRFPEDAEVLSQLPGAT
ncbi:MAG: Rdx family protein [Planctomycetaceae bacterium]